MIYVLHGENTVAAQSYLKEILQKLKLKDLEKVRLDEKNSFEDLFMANNTQSIVDIAKIIIFEYNAGKEVQMASTRRLLAKELAEVLKELIEERKSGVYPSQKEAHPDYLIEMCDKIINNHEGWATTRLHRWLGHIQGCMFSQNLTNLKEQLEIIGKLKKEFPESDYDLVDHRNDDDFFEFDIGGEG